MPHEIVVHKFPERGKEGVDEYHLLLLPKYSEPGFYRQTVSFSAFFHAWNKRVQKLGLKAYPNHDGTHIYYATDRDDWERSQEIMAESLAKYGRTYKKPEFVAIHHGIWEFYKHFGYDYKTKKWKP